MHNATKNILIDLMGLDVNDSDYAHKGRELKERVAILIGDVERVEAIPVDANLGATLLEIVENFQN
jgi:hypothetical protein